MKKILAALLALICTPAAAQNYLRDDGIFHSVVEGTTNGQVLINSGGLLAGTSSFPACTTCAVTNATNIFTADQKFSSGTNITIPNGSTYTMSGAIQATSTGGLSVGGWTQFLGGAMFLGTGANTTGIGTLGFPLGSGQVVFNLNSAGAGAVGGCGGSAIDFDVVTIQTLTIGNASSVNNCLLAGMTSYLSTPTFKSNEGRFFYYSGNPTVGGSTTSLISSLDYAQGLRVNLNTTLVFASLAAPITGASLQLTQANTTVNRIQMDSYAASNFLSGARSNGTKALPTALALDDAIMGINAYGFGTSMQGPAGHIGLYASGTWSATSTPTYVDISTTPSASTTPVSRMRVSSDGGITTGGVASQGSGTLNLLGSLYNNGTAPTGTGGYVRATSPTVSGLTVTGSFTAAGLVTNAAMANAATTVNGQTCTLGATCTVTAVASTITVGTTLVASGTSNGVLTNSGGTLANTAAGTNGQLFLGVTSAQPAFATMSGDATITNAGVLTIANNAVTLAKLATQATNTVLGNATSGSAVPTALAVGSCSTASSALQWTTNTGFGCNTSITAASVPASGLTGTTLAAGVTASSLTSLGTITSLNATAIGAGTPGTGAFTTIAASGIETITNTTDITIPTPYVASGALNVAGGATFSKKIQVLGGFVFVGDGTNTANNGITTGQVGFNMNGGTTGAAAGVVIDMDSGNAQAFTLGTFGAVTNGLVSGVFDLTPTFKSNKSSGDLFRFVKHLTNSTISTALTLGTDLSATFGGAITLGGTVLGGGNQITNVIIGTSTPLAGTFTALAANAGLTVTGAHDTTNNQNGVSRTTMTNNNAGASAQASYYAFNGTNGIEFGVRGTGETAYGALQASKPFVYGIQDFTIMSDGGSVVIASGGSAEHARFTPSGGLALGLTTDTAAGSLLASGTIRFNTGISANGSSGITTTCTIAVGNVLTFTLGILTAKGGVAGCT